MIRLKRAETMNLKAILYLRWSSGKQSSGSSDQRQREALEQFCRDEKWPIEEWVTDDGVSAWTGDNIRIGALGDFLKRVRIEGGAWLVLVVESQDRLSRMNELDFFEWFIPLLKTGLTVAFADHDMIVDQHSIRNQKRQLRRILDGQQEASGYVDKMADRVRAAYQLLRDDGGIVHNDRTCPGFLEIVYGERAQNGRLKRIGFKWRPDRVLLLRRIFAESALGKGLRAIAYDLNVEGVPTWKGGRAWHHSTIRALLRDRAVLGEYQHKSRRQRIAAIGEPIGDYFLKGDCEQAIPDDLFQRANDPDLKVITSQKSQGDKFRDLFSNIARCHKCDSRMTLIERRGRNGSKPEKYLVCDGYKHHGKCDQRRRVRYAAMEKLVLDTLLTVALDDLHFQNDADVAQIAERLATERRALDDVQRSRLRIGDMIEKIDDDDGSLLSRYNHLLAVVRQSKERVEQSEAELRIAKGSASPELHIRRVADIRKDLDHFDPERRLAARRVVKLALNDLILRFEVLPGKQTISYPFRTQRRYPTGVPRQLQYIPTEQQEAVIVLRGGVRFIQLDLEGGRVLYDAHSENDITRTTSDPILSAYRERLAKAA